jgi:type IV secretory pathway VirB2 component (pilin)
MDMWNDKQWVKRYWAMHGYFFAAISVVFMGMMLFAGGNGEKLTLAIIGATASFIAADVFLHLAHKPR